MIRNSTMPPDEIERERGVILQEIKMYQDTPDDLVMDYFSDAAYPQQSLGSNGLGSPEHIQNMTREVLMDYMQTKYIPSNFVISVAGRINHDEIVTKIENDFGGMAIGELPQKIPASYNPSDRIIAKDTEQTHIVVGFEAPHRHNEKYVAGRVLSILLGGGMSSRLFQEIREKRGLVYTISSLYDVVSDHGILGFYAGTGAEHIKELMPAALDEFKKMTSGVVSEDELNRAKAQIKTSILMSREKIMTRADQNARSVLHYGHEYRPKDFIDKVNAVTANDIQNLMIEILQTNPVIASVGQVDHIMTGAEIHKYIRT
jgi:predicted Zn-dependent peptidase